MKKFFLIVCTLFYLSNITAQSKTWSISVSGGAVISQGKFASKNSDDNKAAFAKTGVIEHLSLYYQLQKHYALSSVFELQQNSVNTDAMKEQFYGTNNSNSSYRIYFKSDKWKAFTILTGGYYILNFNSKLQLNLGLMAGGLKTAVPKLTEENSEYNTVAYNSNGSTIIEQDTTNTFLTRNKNILKWSFAYSISSMAKYKLNERFKFICSLDYLASHPKITKQSIPYTISIATPRGTTTVSNGVLSFTGEKEYKQPLSTINLLIGISFTLEK